MIRGSGSYDLYSDREYSTVTNKLDELLTVRQAAALLQKSRGGLLLWIRQGRLGHIRLGQAIRIPKSEIEKLLKSCWVAPKAKRDKP